MNINSREYFGKLSYLREAYDSAREEYAKVILFDLITNSEGAAPHMIKVAQIISDVLIKLAEDKDFHGGLREYANDVHNYHDEVSQLINDLSEFFVLEYRILIDVGYKPKDAFELILGSTLSLKAIDFLTTHEQINLLLNGLLRASNTINSTKIDIEIHTSEPSFLPKSLIKASKHLATGLGILGGGVIIVANCVVTGITAGAALTSIGTGIVSIATGISFLDRSANG